MNSKNAIERVVGLVSGLAVLLFMMALIWRNQPPATPDLARAMRILLALGVGILGGTIPGFLNIKYDFQGIAIRAGGALALFVITFFGSPYVEPLKLREADIKISNIPQIDIRTKASPVMSEPERLDGEVVITVPISIRNVAEPAKAGFLNSSWVELILGTKSRRFEWLHFVNMHEEAFGLWLGIVSSAQPQSVKSGEVLNKEILYSNSNSTLKWKDILSEIRADNIASGTIIAHLVFDQTEYQQNCHFDVAHWRSKINAFITATGKIPGRVTMNCVNQ